MKFSRLLDSDKYATKVEVEEALNKLRLKVIINIKNYKALDQSNIEYIATARCHLIHDFYK